MLTIVADEFGKLDLLYAPCSIEMYRIQYGVSGYHANCYDNLCAAFRELRVEPEPLPSSLNFFMNADVGADGRSTFSPPRTRAGASITSRGNGSRDRTIFAPCVNLQCCADQAAGVRDPRCVRGDASEQDSASHDASSR